MEGKHWRQINKSEQEAHYSQNKDQQIKKYSPSKNEGSSSNLVKKHWPKSMIMEDLNNSGVKSKHAEKRYTLMSSRSSQDINFVSIKNVNQASKKNADIQTINQIRVEFQTFKSTILQSLKTLEQDIKKMVQQINNKVGSMVAGQQSESNQPIVSPVLNKIDLNFSPIITKNEAFSDRDRDFSTLMKNWKDKISQSGEKKEPFFSSPSAKDKVKNILNLLGELKININATTKSTPQQAVLSSNSKSVGQLRNK